MTKGERRLLVAIGRLVAYHHLGFDVADAVEEVVAEDNHRRSNERMTPESREEYNMRIHLKAKR